MSERKIVMLPGPTSVDPAVLRAMSRQIEPHSHPAFIARYRSVLSKLKRLVQTSGEVFVFAGSGTFSQEVGVANFVEPGDRVLCLVNGFFSARFADMVARCGGRPVVLEVPFGEGFTADQVRRALKKPLTRQSTRSPGSTKLATPTSWLKVPEPANTNTPRWSERGV